MFALLALLVEKKIFEKVWGAFSQLFHLWCLLWTTLSASVKWLIQFSLIIFITKCQQARVVFLFFFLDKSKFSACWTYPWSYRCTLWSILKVFGQVWCICCWRWEAMSWFYFESTLMPFFASNDHESNVTIKILLLLIIIIIIRRSEVEWSSVLSAT